MAAEFLGPFADDIGPAHGLSVDRNLIRARQQQSANIIDAAHAAADGQRHEAGRGSTAHHIQQNRALFVTRGDVEKTKLVGTGGVIDHGLLDGITGVAQGDEIDSLHDAAVLDIEARDDADLQHRGQYPAPERAATDNNARLQTASPGTAVVFTRSSPS